MPCLRDDLVTDNIKLVYFTFNKLRQTQPVLLYRDDIISEGMLGLVKAAKSFDGGKNIKFSTYAAFCIHNQMIMFLRKVNRFIYKDKSLDEPVSKDDEGNELCLSDILPAKIIQLDAVAEILDLDNFLKKQSLRDRKIIKAYAKGYKQKEIAEKINLSQSYVSRIILRFQKDYK
jgi:RNA polymerase sporulation-specific sigma factor